jgi:hypothetical protein
MGGAGLVASMNRTLRWGAMATERPAYERVCVPVAHSVLGLQEADDLHVLVKTAIGDNPLPLRD